METSHDATKLERYFLSFIQWKRLLYGRLTHSMRPVLIKLGTTHPFIPKEDAGGSSESQNAHQESRVHFLSDSKFEFSWVEKNSLMKILRVVWLHAFLPAHSLVKLCALFEITNRSPNITCMSFTRHLNSIFFFFAYKY